MPIKEKDGHFEDYIYVEDVAGLLTCVQMGTIEFHGWGARTEDVEAPDRMVIDLDPDEGLDFEDVKKAAIDFHDRLEDAGRGWWLWTCLAGFGLGVIGWDYCRRRKRRREARQAPSS